MKLNMTLNSLPPEVALHILSYLPVSSLANLHSVSRAWNDFLLHYESTAYRQAAFLHGIIHDDAASLDSLVLKRKYAQRMLRNVDSWKALCKCSTSLLTIHHNSRRSTGQAKSVHAFAMHGMASPLRKCCLKERKVITEKLSTESKSMNSAN